VEENRTDENLKVFSGFKKAVVLVSNHFTFISFILVSSVLFIDYYILTETFHLKSEYFFRDILLTVNQEKILFILFIILPVIIKLVYISITYHFMYNGFLNIMKKFYKNFYNHYQKIKKNKLIFLLFLTISFLWVIYGDITIIWIIEFIEYVLNYFDNKILECPLNVRHFFIQVTPSFF